MTPRSKEVAAAAEMDERVKLNPEQRMAVARCARAFSSYGSARKAMASIAKAVIDMRLKFEHNGKPDVRGESAQYRAHITTLYENTIPDETEREAFKAAIRYWIGKEWTARVQAGTVPEKLLRDAGILGPMRQERTRSRSTGEQKSEENHSNGVVTDRQWLQALRGPGGERVEPTEVLQHLKPEVVLHEAQRIMQAGLDHLTPVITLQTCESGLQSALEALLENGTSNLPKRSLKRSAGNVLKLAIEVASLAGADVESIEQEERSAAAV